MALGTITVIESVSADGPVFYDRCTIVGDGAYPTGGTVAFQALYQAAAKTAGILGETGGRTIVHLSNENTGEAQELAYNHANDTLTAFVSATAAEVADTTDLSGNTYNVLVVSK
jgi:hypothetical protein